MVLTMMDGETQPAPPIELPNLPKAFPVAEPTVRRLSLVAYLMEHHPSIIEYLTTDPVQAFGDDELWMSFKEQEMGCTPEFAAGGERLWHPALLGWAVLRMRVGDES